VNDYWDNLDPGFLAPVWLVVGLLAVIAVVLLEIGDERRRRQALRFFAAPHLVSALTGSVSPVKRFWKKFLFLAGIAFLFIALARPHLFYQWQEENRTGIDLLVAVDCSKSMMTDDVKPSRLERAKLAIADFADHLPDDRLGLIAFAGDAFLQVPLTLDHDAFQTAVRELDTDTIPRPGTDIATAIDQAVQALKSQAANAKILILITDGEDLEGRVLDAAREAAKSGLKIYTIGVGTPAGGLIPEEDETGSPMYLHDSSRMLSESGHS
jgi:Ca-activated chloride channel family protein